VVVIYVGIHHCVICHYDLAVVNGNKVSTMPIVEMKVLTGTVRIGVTELHLL
jgi:Zn-dependent alcohol dehydrogenase